MPPVSRPDEALQWAQVIAGGISGGFVVKLVEIIYQEIRRRGDKRQSSSRFIDEHLDPLLKAADELVGKLHSLGREDFRSFADVDENALYYHADMGSTAYLFGKFWAQIEILRLQALYVSISEDERGRRLQAFLSCLESRRVRLIDRIAQRAIGETLLVESGVGTIRYIQFARMLDDSDVARWLQPLANLLTKATHTTERQQILQYCVVVHAMIDTLDPKHLVTREHPQISNKLSKQTWRDLNYRVFRTYLSFVTEHEKYIGQPKTRAENVRS